MSWLTHAIGDETAKEKPKPKKEKASEPAQSTAPQKQEIENAAPAPVNNKVNEEKKSTDKGELKEKVKKILDKK